MRTRLLLIARGVLVATLPWTLTAAELDWPQWRGPAGDGHAPTARDLAVTWSETENIVRKTPLPGRGWSSPVIEHGQIWITTAVEREASAEAQTRALAGNRMASQIAGDLLFMSTSFMQPELLAVKLVGPDRPPEIAWRQKKGAPTMSSPLVVDDLVFMVSDKGVGTCLDIKSGEPAWSQRLGGNFSSSPLFADGRIYVGNRDGDTFVIKPGREYELVATNHLDGGIFATPAAVGRAIFLRTETALYRIEKPAGAGP
jgi:outer membrane protein assembly factor BamB